MAPTIERASISFRIGVPLWLPEPRYEELLRLFEKYRGVTDEITFFTSETHPPLPLEVIDQRSRILARRMRDARRLGYRAGINLLSTLGHHNENLPNSLSTDYTRMTEPGGGVCQGSFCPNDERMRGYIAQAYQSLTAAEPDYIWIDDDVRLFGHMPISCGCFCATCLAIFEKATGLRYRRDTLRAALGEGPLDKKLELRRQWLQHNRNTIRRLFELIERTVHDMKPGLPLGFMTGDRFFEGYDFDTWAEVLSGPGKAEVLWRPGGGQYTDDVLDGIAQKAHQMGRQTALLPTRVVRIQSELESFPYQRLKKSAHATTLEACSYIAGGCTGTAFNVLSMYDEPLEEYEPLVARLKDARPFLDLLAKCLGRAPAIGVYTGWTKDSFIARNPGGDWIAGGGDSWTHHADEVFALGIPPAYLARHASVTVLSGDSVLAMTREEVHTMLSGGVYMDPHALNRLNELGHQDLTGFAVERSLDRDCIEQFLGHPLNKGFAGRLRDGRQSFWHTPAFAFRRVDQKAEMLARIVDYTHQQVAPCCMGVFENRLGGRICVAGYYPWSHVQNLSKSSQLKSVFRWVAKDTLPAYVRSFHKINLWVRRPEQGKTAIALTNSCIDPAEGVTLHILTDKTEARVVDMRCRQSALDVTQTDRQYKTLVLPRIAPWEMCLVLL